MKGRKEESNRSSLGVVMRGTKIDSQKISNKGMRDANGEEGSQGNVLGIVDQFRRPSSHGREQR